MALFCRSLCGACVAAALTPCAPAQVAPVVDAPSEITLESWLRSGPPRLVAWGAHDTLAARDRDLIPDLLSLAGHWQPLPKRSSDTPGSSELSPEQIDERDAMAAVLDTLIQMNVTVPADTLRLLAPDFGTDVAILLSRMPYEEARPLALDFYRAPPEHAHALPLVSAALLAQHPPPGFVADLFANIRVSARVMVVLPGLGGGFGSSGACMGSSDDARENWPETGQYSLYKQKNDGAWLVMPGANPIYATRTVSTRYVGERCGAGVSLGPNERLQLIAAMLGVSSETIPWQTGLQWTIEYRSLDQFEADLIGFVNEQQQEYRATAAELANRNMLNLLDAQQALPELELTLMDMRGEGADPLPRPSNLPSRVEWSVSPF